jgi:hypothetical protein
MFIDISEALIDDKVELKKPVKRQIGTTCRHYDIFKYKSYIDTQFKINMIYDKMDALVSSNTQKPDLERILNTTDNTITEIMLAAEKKCCQARAETNWSVELHIQSILCNYWLKHSRALKTT